MSRSFDRKFGPDFVSSLPTSPGVYRVLDEAGAVVYVGKAKNLRRRLSQYRNAKRRKKHLKMREIVADASRVEFETCASHLDACLLEARLIQELRPKWNVAGAFHFLYPLIGVRVEAHQVFFCFTSRPESFADFELHGAYRSRAVAGDAFRSLIELLKRVSPPVPRSRLYSAGGPGRRDRYARVAGFRGLSPKWVELLREFWRGRSRAAVEELVLALVDSPAARRSPQKTQEHLNALKRFWRHEAQPLERVARFCGAKLSYPIPQRERDLVFLRYRLRAEQSAAERQPEAGRSL